MLVREAMSSKVETISPGATVQECARMMDRLGIGTLPVYEGVTFLGVVTDRDVCCRAIANGRDPAAMTVREIMSSDVASCFDDQDCVDAAHLMEEKHVRRLPVLSRKGTMVGVLSVDDLARCSHTLAGEVLEAAAPWPH